MRCLERGRTYEVDFLHLDCTGTNDDCTEAEFQWLRDALEFATLQGQCGQSHANLGDDRCSSCKAVA